MSDRVFQEADGGLMFVGDFDGLYREESDPWTQSGIAPDDKASLRQQHMSLYYDHSRRKLAAAVNQFLPPHSRLLEVGCGLGYVVDYLSAKCRVIPDGLDVSSVALGRAKERFPNYHFVQADIMSRQLDIPGGYDCVVLNQVLWYVLLGLDTTVSNCHRLLEPGGVLIVSQAFLREQRYGREIVNGFHGLLGRFLTRHKSLFRLITTSYIDEGGHDLRDGLLVFSKISGEAK